MLVSASCSLAEESPNGYRCCTQHERGGVHQYLMDTVRAAPDDPTTQKPHQSDNYHLRKQPHGFVQCTSSIPLLNPCVPAPVAT